MIDEFSQFMAQSEQSLTRMLSETRKYGLFCVMAHQNWTQASERLKGALQNVGIEMILKSGRMDAEYSARVLGSVDPMEVKHLVEDEQGRGAKSSGLLCPLPSSGRNRCRQSSGCKIGEAFVRLADDSVHKVRTRTVPRIGEQTLQHIRRRYLDSYFTRPSSQSQVVSVPAIRSVIGGVRVTRCQVAPQGRRRAVSWSTLRDCLSAALSLARPFSPSRGPELLVRPEGTLALVQQHLASSLDREPLRPCSWLSCGGGECPPPARMGGEVGV